MTTYTHAPFAEVDSEDVSLGNGRLPISSVGLLSGIDVLDGEVFFTIDSTLGPVRLKAFKRNASSPLKLAPSSISLAIVAGVRVDVVRAVIDPLLDDLARLAEELLRFKIADLIRASMSGRPSEISSAEIGFYADLEEISAIVSRSDLSTALFRLKPDFDMLSHENAECARRARVEACHYEAGA